MKEVLLTVISGLIVAALVRVLGWNGVSTKVVISPRGRASTGAKVAILLGGFGTIYGLLYGFSWLAAEGFDSPRAGFGFLGAFMGFVVLTTGRLFAWWSRF